MKGDAQMKDFSDQFPSTDKSFLDICKEFLEKIESCEKEKIQEAGIMIAERILQGEVVYVFGCGGHSWVPPMDMFCRAGGLVPICAGMDVSSATLTGGFRGVFVERVPGYMRALFKYYRIKKGDVVLIFNNVGVNAMVIDAALECQERGAKSIGIAGSAWQDQLGADAPVRHPSKKNLRDLVDVFIDDHNPMGDTVLKLKGMDHAIAPISTITDGYIVRRIEIAAVEEILKRGKTPPVWVSANSPDGDRINEEYIEKYFYKIKTM